MKDVHAASRATYGAPRVHAELKLGRGRRIGRRRVARPMRTAGIQGICHRRKGRHRPAPAVHEDLVKREFVAAAPDQLWCTDVTEHPTRDGKVYCCAVLDVFSRRIVGWSIADHIRSELVVDALQMASWRRQPDPGAVVHSDRGSVCTSWIFGHRLREAGLLGSMGRVASSADNTMMESFWSTMQCELLDRRIWETRLDSRRRSSSGSRRSTTPSAATPPPAISAQRSSKHYTPPPNSRHDHVSQPVRKSGSSSP